MSTIQLTPDTINAYKELTMNPKKHGLTFSPITDCFEKSDTVTAKHELAEGYINHIQRPLPKVILYIIMNEIYGQCDGKDENGNLGYHLKFYQPKD